MIRKVAISLLACACVAGAASDLAFDLRPRVLYNPSLSAPVGWYRIEPKTSFYSDDRVAVFAPEEARKLASNRGYLPYDYPLIKIIWAGPGEMVCRSEAGIVSVPNRPDITALAQDSLGRDMPVWSGCLMLEQNQYFIASPGHDHGWDSRYFGPVNIDDILGMALFLGNEPDIHNPSKPEK